MNFLYLYGSSSGQWINTSKGHSSFSDASIIFNRRVKNILTCNRGSIPFELSRVFIFIGTPKTCFLQPFPNKIN